MGFKQNFTSFWDRVTGKSLYEISKSVNTLEERINMIQLDLDAANIKLASTEIDLEAANVEKEVLKMELDDKKAEIARLKMTVATMQEEKAQLAKAAVSSAELDALTRKVAEEEYLASEYKERLQQIVNLLTTMSMDEKYNDIIRIQTNSIDENGKEMRQVYMSYNDVTVQVDEDVKVPSMSATPMPMEKVASISNTQTVASGSQWLNGGAEKIADITNVEAVSASAASLGIYESFVDIATTRNILEGQTMEDTLKSVDEIVENVSDIADDILDMAN